MTAYHVATGRYGGERTLHADPECDALDEATVRERTFADPDPSQLCGRCVDQDDDWNQGEGDYSYQAALREAAAENLVTDGGKEIVWVRARKSGDRDVFHTDPECSALGRAESITTKPRDVLWDGVTECAYCAGEFRGANDHQGHDTVDALDDAAPDVLPDGGTEIVWTASTGAGQPIDTYHTDRDCSSLGKANTIVERERDLLPDGATHCLVCQDRLDDREFDPDWSYQAALREHTGKDVMTDGGASYCVACHRAVAREDRVKVGCEVYHRQCAPDEAIQNRQFREFETDGGTPPATCTNCGIEFPPEGACPSGGGHNFVAFDGGCRRPDHIVAAVLEGRRRPSDRLRDGLRTDGSGFPEPDRSEQERRARQAATSLVAWSQQAGVDPGAVLNEVREGLPRADGGDPDHYCEICSTEFETIARLIKHDCGDRRILDYESTRQNRQ